jgi:hypothetical protein
MAYKCIFMEGFVPHTSTCEWYSNSKIFFINIVGFTEII